MKKKGMTVKDIRKQAEITAKDVISLLGSSVDHGFMTYPELIRILRSSLKKAIDEMCIFRPEDMLPLSLKEIGLENLYQALEEAKKRETQAIKKV